MQLLLRLYLEKHDPRFRPPLERAIGFVLDSQYPIGGWPQRWPPIRDYPGLCRATSPSTTTSPRRISASCSWSTRRSAAGAGARRDPARHERLPGHPAGAPQAGWGLQYTLDLQPAGARTYEPRALVTHTTAANLEQLMDFYRLTGDRRFLARIPEALDWLESVRLPPDPAPAARPRFPDLHRDRHQPAALRPPARLERRQRRILLGLQPGRDDRPLFGASARSTSPRCGATMRRLLATPREEVARELAAARARPGAAAALSRQRRRGRLRPQRRRRGRCRPRSIRALNAEGWWPTPLRATSNPYRGPGPRRAAAGRFPHHPCRRRERHLALSRPTAR